MSENENTNKKSAAVSKKLTEEDCKYIDEHWNQPGYTDAFIAEKINKPKHVVITYRNKNGLIKKLEPIGMDVPEIKKEEVFKHKLSVASTEEEKKYFYKDFFEKSPRSSRVKKFLSPEDYQYFGERWAEYHVQFPDMTASEEDMLEKMVLMDLRIIGNQKAMHQCHMVQEKLRSELSGRDQFDPENDKDLQILHTIDAYNAQEIEINKQYAILVKEYESVQRSLNATREQREENQKVGADTFWDLVKKFHNKEVREKSGRVAELIKQSQEKKVEKLYEVHKYIDGSLDIPLLNSDIVNKLRQNEKKEENVE